MEQYFSEHDTTRVTDRLKRAVFFSIGLVILFFFVLFLHTIPPKTFPKQTILSVTPGTTVQEISHELETKNYIKNNTLFLILFVVLGNEHSLQTGEYVFDTPQSMWRIVERLRYGQYGNSRVKITFPEGMNRFEMAQVLKNKLPSFDTDTFITLTIDDEGYLFPDTYYFFSTVSPIEVIQTMKNNFNTKIELFQSSIESSNKTLKDIIIMASIVEKEAQGDEDRNVISGILWKRIHIGMPLQVDATFLYLLGKTSEQLTISDLKTDSLYNTYRHKGLPPGPISNPGINSIKASLYPEDSPYLYYLHDRYGTIHYAENFEEHKANKSNYLQHY